MRNTFLPFALPDIDHSELEQIRESLESGWVTTGPKVRQFEAEFAERVGAKHAVAVNSCTAALHLSLEAIGLQRGDEVITTPYTFAATAEVVRYFDARPVFVDIDPLTFNMRADLLEAAITERTRAIIPIHMAGLPADLEAIQAVAQRHGLPVIEDAAHAFPVAYQGRMIGSISDFTCFSFYATKTITTGEGGMICTDNAEYAERCRIMALHGISKDAWKRYTAQGSWYYDIIAPGYKYNLTDIAAGMGLAQLRKAEGMRQRRREIAQRYSDAFSATPELQTPPCRSHEGACGYAAAQRAGGVLPAGAEPPLCRNNCDHGWHLYMLRLNLDKLDIDRAQFADALKARNIGISVHFIPLHLHPYYRETYGYQPTDFPVAYEQFMREISLPIYSKMTDQDAQDVIDAVLEIVQQHRLTDASVGSGQRA
jgi:dTDP-4-amino-4,6-dideoxygalactose transaminase